MDPRPVDFSYRRPRPDNLTYQSYGLSESIFHTGSYSKKFELPRRKQNYVPQYLFNGNPESMIHNRSSRWNVKQQQLSKSYIYDHPSSFGNMQTRVTRDKLSKSLVMGNSASTYFGNQISVKNLPKQKIKNQADSLSNWTYEQIKPKQSKPGEGQDRVFEHQQKSYNIINMRPKNEPDAHRPYPKFSLEDKMIQKRPK